VKPPHNPTIILRYTGPGREYTPVSSVSFFATMRPPTLVRSLLECFIITVLSQKNSTDSQITRPKPIPTIHSPIPHYIPVQRHSSNPAIMSSVRANSASPSSSTSRKAVKASATASAPSSRPPTRSSSDPYYGHEETAVLCARFVSIITTGSDSPF
jgi:hypothetical protein